MELNFVRDFREKQRANREKRTSVLASRVGADIMDHLLECGDIEVRVPVAGPLTFRRSIEQERVHVTEIAQRALAHVNTAPAYKNRLVFNEAKTHEANMVTVRFGENDQDWRLQPAENLHIVFSTPAELEQQGQPLPLEQAS